MSTIYSQYVRLHNSGALSGGYGAADSYVEPTQTTTTTAPFGTGAATTVRLNPNAAGTVAAVPAANAAPSGFGWWVNPSLAANPGNYLTMNDASYYTRFFAGGQWGFTGSVGQTPAATTPITITVIAYKMTSRTAGTEIGRGSVTVTPTAGGETVFVVNLGTVAAQTITYGQTLACEIYMTGTGIAVVGNTGTFYVGSTAHSGAPFMQTFSDPTATIAEPSAGAASAGASSNAAKVITKSYAAGAGSKAASSSAGTRTTLVNKQAGATTSGQAMTVLGSKRVFVSKTAGATLTGQSANTTKTVTVVKTLSGASATGQGQGTPGTKRILVSKTAGAAATGQSSAGKAVTVTKLTAGSAATGSVTSTHYQLLTYAISGYTRDDNTNTTLAACTVKLFDSTDTLRSTATSDATTGYYSFSVAANFVGWVSAYRVGSGTNPDIFGRTANGLTPRVAIIQQG